MVEREDPDNFPHLQTRERCALEIVAYVFNSVTLKNTQTEPQKYFFSTKQILFRVGGYNKKIIFEVKFYFFLFYGKLQ